MDDEQTTPPGYVGFVLLVVLADEDVDLLLDVAEVDEVWLVLLAVAAVDDDRVLLDVLEVELETVVRLDENLAVAVLDGHVFGGLARQAKHDRLYAHALVYVSRAVCCVGLSESPHEMSKACQCEDSIAIAVEARERLTNNLPD